MNDLSFLKYLLSITIYILSTNLSAQTKVPNKWSDLDTLLAYNKAIEAKAFVDSIYDNHREQTNGQFYLRKAEVYYRFYRQSIDAFGVFKPEWLIESNTAYNKALVLLKSNTRVSDAMLTKLYNYVGQAKMHLQKLIDKEESYLAYQLCKEASISLKLYNEIGKTDKKDLVLLKMRAITSYNQGFLAEAWESYEAILKEGDATRDVYRGLATVHKEMDDYPAAIDVLETAVLLFPDDNDILMDWIEYSILADQEDSLVVSLDELVSTDTLNPTRYFVIANVYNDVNRNEEAEQYYLRSLAIDSTFVDAHYNLATLYYNQAIEQNKLLIGDSLSIATKDSIITDRNKLYKLALPHFKKARSVDPVTIDKVIKQLER